MLSFVGVIYAGNLISFSPVCYCMGSAWQTLLAFQSGLVVLWRAETTGMVCCCNIICERVYLILGKHLMSPVLLMNFMRRRKYSRNKFVGLNMKTSENCWSFFENELSLLVFDCRQNKFGLIQITHKV